jgi:predicted RNase H-like HicB family nuclease
MILQGADFIMLLEALQLFKKKAIEDNEPIEKIDELEKKIRFYMPKF